MAAKRNEASKRAANVDGDMCQAHYEDGASVMLDFCADELEAEVVAAGSSDS